MRTSEQLCSGRARDLKQRLESRMKKQISFWVGSREKKDKGDIQKQSLLTFKSHGKQKCLRVTTLKLSQDVTFDPQV